MKKIMKIVSLLLVLTLSVTSFPIDVLAQDNTVNEISTKDDSTNKYIGDGYEVEFKISNQWDGAFNGELVITNTGDKPLENWTLKYDFNHEITNMWNAQIISHENNTYTIKNLGWNQDIQPGNSISIGFTANYSDKITSPEKYSMLITNRVLNSNDFSVNFKVTSDWGQAFNGEITITNNTKETIEDWSLEFDFDRNIDSFWTAEILEHTGNHYVIKNAGYNANILAGQSITLGFSGNPGNVDNTPSDYKLIEICEKTDESNNEVIDSDNDGISDDYEKDVLIQAMIDSGQEYGNPDPNADYDSDGLTNIEEYNLGTNPASKDTDEDGLSDYDEVNVYKTNPNLYDTDGDGIGDGSEIQNGLNPLSTDTDGNGILDGDEVSDKVLLDSKYEDFDIDTTGTIPNVTIKGKGDFNTKIEIKDESNNEKFAQINSMVGSPFNFEHDDTLEFESSTLTFKVSDKILSQHELSNLKIAYYNEETNSIEILESSLDEEKKEVTTNVDHFSTYFLIDVEDFEYDIDILNENSKIDTGKADVVFTIDTTVSMYSSIYNVKNNIKEVVSKLKEDKVDVRLGLVGFKDITCDGLYSTKDYGWFTDVDNFKSAVNSLIASGGGDWEESTVDGLEVSRRKDFRSSVTKYIVLITDAGYKIGTADNPSMTMEEEIELLKKDNISTSVITNSSAKGYFTSLYTETNGIIADIDGNFSEILQPLIEKMATISNDGVWIRLSNGSIVKLDKDPALGDYSVDTDGDGVPDLLELTKEVSVGYFDYNTHKTVTYKYWTFYSNPTKKDTDGDGLNDETDAFPSKFDVSIKENNDKYVIFNTGNKWTKFGEEIYSFHDELTDTTTSIHTDLDYQRFLESDLYKKEQILVKNRKLKLSTDELAALVVLDINGVRDYLTNKSDSTINKVFTKVTGKKPHYYKHQWTSGWTDKGEEPLEKSWLDFFSGDVVTDARATLTLYYSLDLNKVIMDVAFVGVVMGATYLGAIELATAINVFSMFGIANGIRIYCVGGSSFARYMVEPSKELGIYESTPVSVVQKEEVKNKYGIVQSRINIAKGSTRFTPLRERSDEPVSSGWDHVVKGHFNRELANNRSVFSISEEELKSILREKATVSSPIIAERGGQYKRLVDTGRIIGKTSLKFGGVDTTWIEIYTDRGGNLITCYPIPKP